MQWKASKGPQLLMPLLQELAFDALEETYGGFQGLWAMRGCEKGACGSHTPNACRTSFAFMYPRFLVVARA